MSKVAKRCIPESIKMFNLQVTLYVFDCRKLLKMASMAISVVNTTTLECIKVVEPTCTCPTLAHDVINCLTQAGELHYGSGSAQGRIEEPQVNHRCMMHGSTLTLCVYINLSVTKHLCAKPSLASDF